MMNFDDYKKIVSQQGDLDLYKQYEEYRTKWLNEEQKVLEIKNAQKEKRANFRFEFFKYFITSVVIGGFTAITTHVYKEYELQLETRKQDSQTIEPYVTKFLDLMEKDSLRYNRAQAMCEFLSYTIIEDNLKKGFMELSNIYKQRILDAKQDIVTTSKSLKNINIAIDYIKSETKPDTNSKSAEYQNKIMQLNFLQAQANQLLSKKYEALAFVKANSENPLDQKAQNPEKIAQYDIIYSEERYTGPGWYSDMIDDISIYMNKINLDLNTATFEIKKGEITSGEVIQKIGEKKETQIFQGEYKISIIITRITKKRVYYEIKIEKLHL